MAQASRRTKLMLLLLGPVVFFGLCELVLRVAGYRFDRWAAYDTGQPFDELVEREVYTPDPDLLWTLRPNTVIDAPGLGFESVRTNSLGLRGEEIPREKEPGELRILCLGDSVTFGIGLRDGETWPDRLAQALRARAEMAGRRIRVVIGAVPGWSSVQGMRLYRRIAWVKPDVVIFWFGMNDAKAARDLPDSAQKVPGEGMTRAVSILGRSRAFQLIQAGVFGLRRSFTKARRVSVEEFRGAVDRLREDARSGGPQAIVVRFPEVTDVTIQQFETIIRRAEEEGVDFVFGPRILLIPLGPAPGGTDLIGKRVKNELGEEGVGFDLDRAKFRRAVADMKGDLERLRDFKANVDRLLAELPEDSIDGSEFFGSEPRERIFSDNCHLKLYGARMAGEALARKVAELVR